MTIFFDPWALGLLGVPPWTEQLYRPKHYSTGGNMYYALIVCKCMLNYARILHEHGGIALDKGYVNVNIIWRDGACGRR